MGQVTFTEAEIGERHKERVAALMEQYGDMFKVPRSDIEKLQAANKEDWVQHIAERDGRTSELKKLLKEGETAAAPKKRPAKSSSAPTPAPKKPAESSTSADVKEINEGLDVFLKH